MENSNNHISEENKRLLLIDLCEKLPYGVKVSITAHNLAYKKDFGKTIIANLTGILIAGDINNTCFTTCYNKFKTQGNDINTIKPYLRPMSSMTEEEKKHLNKILEYQYYSDDSCMCEASDWLNAKQFDYRGLIPLGLALEAPKDMYV